MRSATLLAVSCVLLFGRARAMADEPPAPPAPPVAPPEAVPPAPPPLPPTVVAPTPEEKRRVVEMAPVTIQPGTPFYTMPAAPRAAAPCEQACDCGHQPCFIRRDGCGYRVDACGNRWGRWSVTLEGAAAWIGSPDGILGEPIFLQGNQLEWDNVDYDAALGGRLTFVYHTDCTTRFELRGTYYGNPVADQSDTGFFGATPGDDGLGDISSLVDADFHSEAELWSVEFNWWHEVDCSGHWRYDIGFGFRFIAFDENASVDFDVVEDTGGFPVDESFVTSDVTNRFYGLQLLGAIHYDATECFELYATLKAMFGSIQRDIDITDNDIFAGGTHTASSNDDDFVGGVEFEVGAIWRISRSVGIVASYDFLYLSDVQHAEDAMDFSVSNSGAVQAKQSPDQLVVHTVFLGVTFNF